MLIVYVFFGLIYCAIALGFCLIGSVAMFGSFFFEQTRSQMTWLIAGEHLLIFLSGALSVSIGIWMFSKIVKS